MKYLRKILVVIMCVVSMALMFGCKNNAQISFEKSEIEMYVGEEIELSSILKTENCSFSDLKISTSNNQIVFVSPSNVLIARNNGVAIVKVKAFSKSAYVSIKVNTVKGEFETVTGLKFDYETMRLTWNEAFVLSGENNVFASSYVVSLTKDSQTTEQTTNNNYIEITETGKYTAKVKAKHSAYLDSEFCEQISFEILERVQNLSYNDETETLSWTQIQNCEYVVEINGISKLVQQNTCEVELKQAQTYNIKVFAKNDDAQSESTELELLRLSTPTLEVSNGVLHFDVSQANVGANYQLEITTSGGQSNYVNNNSGNYAFEEFEYGNYYVSIQALGNGQNVLSSQKSDVVTIEKLGVPSLAFNQSNCKFTTDKDNVQLYIKNLITNQIETFNFENKEYTFVENAGIYEIYAVQQASEDNQIDSEESNTIHIKRLPTITNLTHFVENEYSYLNFISVSGCEGYQVLIDDVSVQYSKVMLENKEYLKLSTPTDTLFASEKSYAIKVLGFDNSFATLGSNYYVLSEDATSNVLNVVRLSSPSLMQDDAKVYWDTIENATYYEYKIFKDNQLFDSGLTNLNTISKSNLSFGDYRIEVVSKGDESENLSALTNSNIQFKIRDVLETPQLVYVKQSQKLVVYPVENAEEYEILLNDSHFATLSQTLEVSVSSVVSNSGTYVFKVVAKSVSNSADDEGDGNLFSSSASSVMIEKLTVPQELSISDDSEILVKDVPLSANSSSPYLVLINDVETKNFDNENSYEIKVKFCARQDVGNLYYIDSEISTFNVVRLDKVENIVLSNLILSWENIVDAEKYLVRFENGENIFEIESNTNLLNLTQNENLKTYIEQFGDGASVFVKAYVSEMDIDVNTEGKISSLESEAYLLSRLATPNITQITPEESLEQKYVTLHWEQVEFATSYNVSYQSEINSTSNTSYKTPQIQNVQVEILIQAIAEGYLPSQWTTIKVERVPEISTVQVENDETISAGKSVGASGVLVDELYNIDEFNLNSVTETLTSVTLRNIGDGLIGDVYYLNSSTTTFNFMRLATMGAVVIENNQINWNRVADADEYQLKISNGEDELVLQIQDATSISIYDQRILDFVSEDILNYSINIRAIVVSYSLDKENTGYLSGNYNSTTVLSKLSKVSNLTVLGDDSFEQKNVTISFDALLDAENYEIYVNNTLLVKTTETTYTTNKLTYNSEFSNVGSFEISVIATKQNCLSSSVSEKVLIKRLASISNSSLSVSKNGEFSYAQNIDVDKYVVYYEKAQGVTSSKVELSQLAYDYSEVVEMEYDGLIVFYVLAKGDRQNTLSSDYASVSITKLAKPQITLHGDYLEISSENNKATNVLTVKYKVGESETFISSYNLADSQKFVYPKEWEEGYTGGKFVFEVYATKDGYINSNTYTCEQEKLSDIVFDGFYRDEVNYDKLYLQADVGNLKLRDDVVYTLSIKNSTFVDNIHKPDKNGKLVYEITGDFDACISKGNFEISIIASSNSNMNSRESVISGKRLAQVSNIYSKDGVLTWTKCEDVSAVSYLLKLAYNLEEENLQKLCVKDIAENYDLLTGISGQIVANVKVVGNVTSTISKENIILDSCFKQGANGLENYTAYKLPTLENLTVLYGEFSFDEVELATGYKLICEENGFEYNLTKDEENMTYSSALLYQGDKKLTTNTLYNVKIQATSTKDDTLYSDFSQNVKIKVLENSNTPENVTYSWSATDVNKFKIKFNNAEYSSYTKLQLSNNNMSFTINCYADYYNLDCNDSRISGGNFEILIKCVGGSSLVNDEFYYLSSNVVKVKDFVKIEVPTLKVENGKLVWEAVENANAYYIYYYNITGDEQFDYNQFVNSYTQYSTPTNQTYFVVPDSFGNKLSNTKYYFGVRAVYNVEQGDVAPSFVSVIEQQSEDDVKLLEPIIKLKAPDEISLINGTLIWKKEGLDYDVNIDIFNQTATLNAGNNPFVYSDVIEELFDNVITLKFIDDKNFVRTYKVEAYKLFRPELADSALYSLIAQALGFDEDFEYGWPNLSFITDEIGNLTPGEHYLTLSQEGNDKTWLTSMFNTGFEIYVPHAPKIKISNYILSWDEVFLPTSKTYGAEQKYAIISEDSFGKRSIVYTTNDLSVDLRELVNSDALVSGNHKIYVMVLGDSSYFVNGFISKGLDILVLPQISANICDGILNWDSVSQTNSYKLKLITTNSDYNFEGDFTSNSWDFNELSETDAIGNVLTYTLKMQPIGNGTNVISGKEADYGKIIKLATPQVDVQKGVFVWDNVLGNCGYQVLITTQNELLEQKLNKDKVLFESQVDGFNNYNFRTLGSTFDNLSSANTSYVISNLISAGIDAVLLPSVLNSKTYEGNLVWQNVKDYSDASVNGYKLSFDDLNYYPDSYLDNYDIVQFKENNMSQLKLTKIIRLVIIKFTFKLTHH